MGIEFQQYPTGSIPGIDITFHKGEHHSYDLRLGYNAFVFNHSISLMPTLAFGYEVNTNQDGADVGQGAILLGGISLGYRF